MEQIEHLPEKRRPGRQHNSVGRRTRAIRDISDRAVRAGQLPLEVLLKNMRYYQRKAERAEVLLLDAIDRKDPPEIIAALERVVELRDNASSTAAMCARFVHPTLASVTLRAVKSARSTRIRDDMSDREAAEAYAATLLPDMVDTGDEEYAEPEPERVHVED